MPGSKRRRLLHAIVPQDVLDCVRYLLSRVEEDDYPWMWGPTPVWYEDSDHEDGQAETDRQHFEAMEAASREGGQPTPAGGGRHEGRLLRHASGSRPDASVAAYILEGKVAVPAPCADDAHWQAETDRQHFEAMEAARPAHDLEFMLLWEQELARQEFARQELARLEAGQPLHGWPSPPSTRRRRRHFSRPEHHRAPGTQSGTLLGQKI